MIIHAPSYASQKTPLVQLVPVCFFGRNWGAERRNGERDAKARPDTFWVQINNPIELFNRGENVDFTATVTAETPNQSSCTRQWSLSKGFPDAASGYYAESTVNTNGSFVPCPDLDDPLCLPTCSGVPVRTLTSDEAAAGVVRWGTPALSGTELRFSAIGDAGPPG